jgi:hypothetical protein
MVVLRFSMSGAAAAARSGAPSAGWPGPQPGSRTLNQSATDLTRDITEPSSVQTPARRPGHMPTGHTGGTCTPAGPDPPATASPQRS